MLAPLQFKNAFNTAFEYHAKDYVWAPDNILRTTVVECYIYPFLAKQLGMYCIGKLGDVDASFYLPTQIQAMIENRQGWPKEQSPYMAIEHENHWQKSAKKGEEMEKLCEMNLPVNVLVTYTPGQENTQKDWLMKKWAPLLHDIDPVGNVFLAVLPIFGENMYSPPSWRFWLWDHTEKDFALI